MRAAENNALDVAKLLIYKGSDVDAIDEVWYFAAVVPHALQRRHQWCEWRAMSGHYAGRDTTCAEHRMHSVTPITCLLFEYKRMTMLIQCGRA